MKRLFVLAALLLALSRVPLADSDGCSSFAFFQSPTDTWEILCSGSTCGNPPNCQILQGGSGVFTFSYCGCLGGSPPTPKCCYVAVGIFGQFGNGLCKDMGAPAGSECPAGNDCNAAETSTNHWVGQCKFISPPPP